MAELKRVLGLSTLTFYGLGMILGAGIYSVIGKAAGIAGENLWISFIVAAVCAAITALSYAELSSMIPKAGAEYSFLVHAFPLHRWIGTASGIMMAFSASATATAVALAFSGYFSHFTSLPLEGTAIGLIILFCLLSIYGIQESSRLNVAFTLIEAGGLLIIIFLGISSSKMTFLFDSSMSEGILPASSLIIFAYLGFENLVNFTEESKNPKKDIPRAVLLSLSISTVLYLLTSLAAIALFPTEKLATSQAPLMDIAMTQSSTLGRTLGLVALFSTANTVLIAILSGSRILYGVSKGKDLPPFIGKIHSKRQTPWVACLFITGTALLLVPIGSVELAASLASFATMLSFFLVNTALITLRFTQPEAERPFQVPFSIGPLPIPTTVGILITLLLLSEFKLIIYGISALFFAAIALAHFLFKRGFARSG